MSEPTLVRPRHAKRPRQPCRPVLAGVLLGLSLASDGLALDPKTPVERLVHEHWDARDGLPEGAVFAVVHGSDGYLWLGTQSGIVRFDGARFTLFEEGRLGLKQHSFARRLAEGPDGSIWAALVGGVARYRGGRFDFFDEQQGLLHPFVYALAPGPEGSLWVGTGGSGVWRLREGRFEHHPAYREPGLPAQVNDLAVDREGTVWVAAGDGVAALGRAARRFTAADGLGSAVANAALVDRRGQVWIGTRAGLSRWDGARFRTFTRRDGLTADDVTALLEDRAGTLWVGTRGGGLDRRTGERFAAADDALSRELSVFALAEDREGSLWVGSDRGLERYRTGTFATFGRGDGLADEHLLNVAARRAGGVWVLDGSGALLVHDGERARVVAPSGTIPGSGMLGMAEMADGTLYVGGNLLRRLRDGRWESFSRDGGEFSVVMPDGDDRLLVAQTDGEGRSTLSLFDGRQFRPIASPVPLVHVQRMLRDRAGRLWVSTGGAGLVRIDPGGSRVFGVADGLPHAVVYGLAEDASGSLWIATRSGLARLKDDHVTSYARFGELPHRSPVQLHLDGRGRLWVTTDDGVYRIRTADLADAAEGRLRRVPVQRFATVDGLHSVEISWRSSGQAATADGRLWYASSRGLSVVDTLAAADEDPPPPVVIEELSAGGAIPRRDANEIAEGRERIQFRFAAPTLIAAGALRFRFQLEGYDEDWIDEQTSRVASYTNLPPGAYTFQVAVRRSGGGWGSAAKAGVRILPRWYERRAARLLALVSPAFLIIGFYRLRVRRMHLREAELVRKVDERTKELREEVGERRRAEEAVRTLNGELENRVRQRTAQLEETNQALEDDVAKRQRAESALAAEKERLAVTLRSIAEGVLATDVHGRVALMNPVAERHTGWSSEDAAGRLASEVFRLVDRFARQPLPDGLARVLSSSGSVAEDLARVLLVDRRGRETLVDVSAAPIHDRDSRVVGAVLVFRDVTERTRVEERMQQVQKLDAVGTLAAGIAHDFNNLLMGIFGQVDLARAALPADAPAAQRLERALEVLDHAKSLARQLLTFSAGGRPAKEPHGLGDLLRASARFVLSGSTVSAEVEVPEDLWPCDVDPAQIRQTIDNLLLNARQAMPAGGRLRIRAGNLSVASHELGPLPAGRYVELRISDEGEGIPPEIHARVFDPFFTTKPSGSGLGLATVQSIVSQHGGSIDFESAPGCGTTFRIRLPAAGTLPPEARRMAAAEPAGGRGRVLVMDDEPVVLEIALAALEHLGYEAEGTPDGQRAVAAFEAARAEGRAFDAVILDLTVAGGVGGVEALARLQAIAPGVRAIATSGYSSGPVLAEPDAYGFRGTLPKPYTIAELATVVASVLEAPPVSGPGSGTP